jgi:hypothetical protein
LNAYELLAGGHHGWNFSTNVPQGSVHPPVSITNTVPVLSGWDLNTNTSSVSSDAVNHYVFDVTNGMIFTTDITLTWWRQQGQSDINDLDLFLYNAANSNLVACSTSRVDNVEHIYVPQLPAGRYDLEVVKYGGASVVSSNETYAVAWGFVSPALQLVKSGGGAALQWPAYPSGYLVEASTNLLSGGWSTNGVSNAAITNGLNSIPVNRTNAAQFFRLRSPNL